MTLTQIFEEHYPYVKGREKKDSIGPKVSREIKTFLPGMVFKKVKEDGWMVIDYPNELIFVVQGIINKCIDKLK